MEADLQSANFRQDELEQQMSAAQAAKVRSEADAAAFAAQASAAAKHAAADLAAAQAAVAAAEATAADNAAALLQQQGGNVASVASGKGEGSGGDNSEVRSLQAMLRLLEATAATRDAQLVALGPLLPVLDAAHSFAASTLGLGSVSAAAASFGALVFGFAAVVALLVLSCCAPKKAPELGGGWSSSRSSNVSSSKGKASSYSGSGSSQPVGAASPRSGSRGASSEAANDEEGIEEAEERRRREDSSGEGSFGLPPARMRSSDAMSAPRPFQHCGTESVSVSDGRATKRPGRGQNQ